MAVTRTRYILFAQYIVFALGVPDFKTTFPILVILVEAKLPENKSGAPGTVFSGRFHSPWARPHRGDSEPLLAFEISHSSPSTASSSASSSTGRRRSVSANGAATEVSRSLSKSSAAPVPRTPDVRKMSWVSQVMCCFRRWWRDISRRWLQAPSQQRYNAPLCACLQYPRFYSGLGAIDKTNQQ